MTDNPAPKGSPQLTVFFTANDAAKAVDFYVDVFGAEVTGRFEGPDGKVARSPRADALKDPFGAFNVLKGSFEAVSSAGPGTRPGCGARPCRPLGRRRRRCPSTG
jgi:catechol 2,3-dioxygenase-like lactoylglutathione lyase family enzyme